jgi:hypothetical protein
MLTTAFDQGGGMKSRLSLGAIILAMAIVMTSSIPVMAASQITVVTSVAVQGNFQEHSSLAMQEGGGIVGASEDTMAVSGTTTYQKSETIDTGPKNVAGDNLHTDRIIEFNATPGTGGRMTSDENVIVATISSSSTTDPGCQFGDGAAGSGGTSNSIVEAGSTLDVTEVSAHTTSDARVVSDTPGTPVALDYSISAEGINQTPGDLSTAAVGSATAYVNANIQSGDTNSTTPDSRTEYHDITSVDGLFDLAKSVSYSSH